MPYLDEDILYNNVEEKYKSAKGKAREAHSDVLDTICELPRADVVPKSEVEMLQAEAECLKNANADLALALLYECEPTKEHLHILEATVREKVAMEIFEEIEYAMGSNYSADSDSDYPMPHYYEDLREDIAELKKKYTEGEK